MSEVQQVIVQIKGPSRAFPAGQVTYGYFTVTDGGVTLTDKNGRPAGDETGTKFSHKLANETPREAAARMTKQLRLALKPGGKSPVHGFDAPIVEINALGVRRPALLGLNAPGISPCRR